MKREPSRKIVGTFSLTIKTDRDLPGSRNSRRKYGRFYIRLLRPSWHSKIQYSILDFMTFINIFILDFPFTIMDVLVNPVNIFIRTVYAVCIARI